jgi:hypothetical protein
VLAALAVVAVAVVHLRSSASVPHVAGCPVLPASSPWNRRVDELPVARDSSPVIRAIGAGAPLQPYLGLPLTIVARDTPKVVVRFRYAAQSDPGPYPIPPHVALEHPPDLHAVIVERGACRLYELWELRRTASGWAAGSGAIFDLRSTHLRPRGWTSADAAGLPILPGLLRYDEVAAGKIAHAIRFTAPRTRRAYVYPARHFASSSRDPALPAMGVRVRLKASFDTSGFPQDARVVLDALKRYGAILADHGKPWLLVGTRDPRWSRASLAALRRVRGSDLEVVDTSTLRP